MKGPRPSRAFSLYGGLPKSYVEEFSRRSATKQPVWESRLRRSLRWTPNHLAAFVDVTPQQTVFRHHIDPRQSAGKRSCVFEVTRNYLLAGFVDEEALSQLLIAARPSENAPTDSYCAGINNLPVLSM